jgi:hypothetical protein
MNISDTNKIIDNASDAFEAGIDDIQKIMHEKIEKLIFNFNSSNGRILNVKENHQHVVQIKSFTNKLLKENGFNTKVSDLLESLNHLNDNAVSVQKKLNALDVDKSVLSPLQKQFQKNFFTAVKEAKINGQFTEPIRQLLFQSVVQGGNVGDAQKRLRDLMLGEKGKKGILSRWAGQVSRDALGQYNGLINNTIRKEYKLAGYLYVGNLVEDSRAQCSKWLDKGFIKYKDLNKEIKWALNNGTYQGKKTSGMVRVTTKDTFATYRGGYNCRHEAIASNEPDENPEELPPIETDSSKIDSDTATVINKLKKFGEKPLALKEANHIGVKYDIMMEDTKELFELKNPTNIKQFKKRFRESFSEYHTKINEVPSKNEFQRKKKAIINLDFKTNEFEISKSLNGQLRRWEQEGVKKEIEAVWIIHNNKLIKMDVNQFGNYSSILNQLKQKS